MNSSFLPSLPRSLPPSLPACSPGQALQLIPSLHARGLLRLPLPLAGGGSGGGGGGGGGGGRRSGGGLLLIENGGEEVRGLGVRLQAQRLGQGLMKGREDGVE